MKLVQIGYLILLSLLLFWIINYFNRKEKDNRTNRIIIPLIYIIIVSAILDYFNLSYIKPNLYLVILIEMFIRLFYNFILKENYQEEINTYLKNYFISIFLGLLINVVVINRVDSIIPSDESLKVIVWLIIITYLYQRLNKFTNKVTTKENEINIYSQKEYQKIIIDYAKYKSKYSNIIDIKDKNTKTLIYAILIYETKKRSKFQRDIDNFFFGKLSKVTKLGVMQIETKVFITDEESIIIAMRKINNIIRKLKLTNPSDLIESSLKIYYNDSLKEKEVSQIYKIISDFNKLD